MSAPEEEIASSVSTSRAWGAVPVWITTAPELPDGAVRLFALIAAKYTPRPGYVATSPTIPQLAAELGVNERTVRRNRDALIEAGALAVVKRRRAASVYLVAGVGADGPVLADSDTNVRGAPGVSGQQLPLEADNFVQRTSSTENSKSAPSDSRVTPEPPRTSLGRHEHVELHHADAAEKARVRDALRVSRARLGLDGTKSAHAESPRAPTEAAPGDFPATERLTQ